MPLAAVVAQELQRQPDVAKDVALTSSLGKRATSMSDSGESTHDKKKTTTDANSASEFASVVAYTVR